MAVHLPHRPQPIHVAVVQIEHRIERRHGDAAHVAATAEPAVEAVVEPVSGHGARPGLAGVLKRRQRPHVERRSNRRCRRQAGGWLDVAPQRPLPDTERRMQAEPGERPGPPDGHGRGVGARAGRVGREVAELDFVVQQRIAIRSEKILDDDRADRIGPVPVGQHHAGHVRLQLLLQPVQEVPVPGQEPVRAESAVTEVHADISWRVHALDEPVKRDEFIPAAVLIRRAGAGVHDVGFHQHAGLHEGLALGRGQELRVLSYAHGRASSVSGCLGAPQS